MKTLLFSFLIATQIPFMAVAQIQSTLYSVKITENPFKFEIIKNGTEKPLFVMNNSITVQHFEGSKVYEQKPYTIWEDGKSDKKKIANIAKFLNKTNNWNTYYLFNENNDSLFLFKYRLMNNKLNFNIEEINPPTESDLMHSRISVGFYSASDDSYMGMGMRFGRTNHYGTIVSNWCKEVGVNLPIVSNNATAEGQDITYYPVPFYLNLKGYGFLLNSFHYNEFDFAKTNADVLKITNYSNKFEACLFLSEDPLEIISSYQAQTGKYKKPKPWVFGVWAAATTDWQSKIKGQTVNENVLKIHRDNKIPLSAIMAEDWYWNTNIFKPTDSWTLNENNYPNYSGMIAEQHKAGVKHIGYFLPYFAKNMSLFKKSPMYEEGKKLGYFTKTKKGEAYLFKFFIWDEAQVDVTNPVAVKWFGDKFYNKIVSAGVDGWMNDFGEYTPYNSLSYNGEYGVTMHNKFPLYWAKAAQEFCRINYPNKDFAIFSRSGAIGQQSNVDFHFTGDRNANYDNLSGFGGQVIGLTTAGISAHPNTSIDIGAYNCEKTKAMDKLMLFRWIELGALVPVMRLHRGLPLCDHWRFDEDIETLNQWKKYATLHAKLFPYIYTLAQQAEDKGLPMVRHLSLHYPKDRQASLQEHQFLLGDRILSAPVTKEKDGGARNDLKKGTTIWKVYLPEGTWYHYWTNKTYQGNAYYDVPASPGFLPLFILQGKIIPTYNKEVNTFVENVEDASIKDFEYVNESIEVIFYGYGQDAFKLWDGTTIFCKRVKGSAGTFNIENGKNRRYNCVFVD
jgi:sulfoquinovosidase